jgi:hypothetical protein
VKSDVTIKDVYELIQDIREEVRQGYVRKEEFLPVKNILYGLVTLILTTVAVAILAQVVKAVSELL